MLFIIIPLLSFLAQWRFKSKFETYSKTALTSGMTGKEVAEKMLSDHALTQVRILAVDGHLVDHYNPEDRTVQLSAEVYHGRSIAAAAVAAHECGHAIQHATDYTWLKLRTTVVPIVSIASNLLRWVFMLGIILIASTFGYPLLILAFVAMILVTAFSIITLPVEFDASQRALAWLNTNDVMRPGTEQDQAKDALWWAAITYVVAALGAIAQLVYLAMMLFGRKRTD